MQNTVPIHHHGLIHVDPPVQRGLPDRIFEKEIKTKTIKFMQILKRQSLCKAPRPHRTGLVV